MDKICYIFGAGERTSCELQLDPQDYVIAADGGYDYLLEIGLRADTILGDFDSVSANDLPADSVRYPREKDDTDMMLAIRLGLEKGYREFAIYGGLGGRLDHTIANIQCLQYLSQNNAQGTLHGRDYSICVITDSSLVFEKTMPENVPGNICSVFSLSDISINVNIRGLRYETEKINMTNTIPLGVSNEFTGRRAVIEVEKGVIAVLWHHIIE